MFLNEVWWGITGNPVLHSAVFHGLAILADLPFNNIEVAR